MSPGDDIVSLLEEDHELIRVRFRQLETVEAPELRREAFWKLTSDLVRHEVAEEVVVYPALREDPGGDELADARITEQATLEMNLKGMENLDPASPEFTEAVGALKEMVLAHARRENIEVFGLLKSTESSRRLVELGELYLTARRVVPSRPHPRLPDTPPGKVHALGEAVRRED